MWSSAFHAKYAVRTYMWGTNTFVFSALEVWPFQRRRWT